MKTLFVTATLLGFTVLATADASAAQYTVTDLGSAGAGPLVMVNAINNSGAIAGFGIFGGFKPAVYDGTLHNLGLPAGGFEGVPASISSNGLVAGTYQVGFNSPSGFQVVDRAFLYDGTMQDLGLGVPGNYSSANGVNANGQVTGWFGLSSDALSQQAFLYDHGTTTFLGTLGGSSSIGTGINDSGTVVGYSAAPNGFSHAFLYDGALQDLGILLGDAVNSQANAINANGDVAISAANHAIFLYNGSMNFVGFGVANAINSSGQIAGLNFTNQPGDDPTHAIIADMEHGAVDLNTRIDQSSGWILDDALGINDQGQIVGFGSFNGNITEPFLLTPIPEPASAALATLALFALATYHMTARRRQSPRASSRC